MLYRLTHDDSDVIISVIIMKFTINDAILWYVWRKIDKNS